MSTSKIRAVVLGTLAVMLAGSVMAATASAEAGPFWHHRQEGESGEGAKIPANKPENFSGHGGVQTLTGEISNIKVELISAAAQVKGQIQNTEHQGQIKVAIFYQPPSLKINGETPKECIASVGQQGQFTNIVQLKGHLAWKWDGTTQQLTEQPQRQQKWDIVFTQAEPQEQTGRPLIDLRKAPGAFAEIKFTGAGCGVLSTGPAKVAGAEVGIPAPSQLESWSKKLNIRTLPSGQFPKEVLGEAAPTGAGFLQHIWVGAGYQPLVLGLTLGGNAANLSGQTDVDAEQQEIAVFEK
jgi:hypothetical protein